MKTGLSAITLGFGIMLAQPAHAQNTDFNGSISVKDKKERDYPTLAKVSLAEAIEAASTAVTGKATEAELDDERGFLVYEVTVIADDGSKHKVTVDAGDKRILQKKG